MKNLLLILTLGFFAVSCATTSDYSNNKGAAKKASKIEFRTR